MRFNRKIREGLIAMCSTLMVISTMIGCSDSAEVVEEVSIDSRVDREELAKFGQILEYSLLESDAEHFRTILNVDSVTSPAEALYGEGALEFSEYYIHGLPMEWVEHVNKGGNVRVTKTWVQDGVGHIMLRLFVPPMEVKYYDLKVLKIGETLMVTDVFSYDLGVSLAELTVDLAEVMQDDARKMLFEDGMKILDTSYHHLVSGDPELAWYYFNKIDHDIKEVSLFSLRKLPIAYSLDKGKQVSTLLDIVDKLDKSSPSYSYYSFYLKSVQEEYDQARIHLVNLKSEVGNDPMLTYLEGMMYYNEMKYDEAIAKFTTAIVASPTIESPHYAKLITCIEKGDFVDAADCLLTMEDFFNVEDINWEKELMAYPEFLMSPEYENFLERIETPLQESIF